MIRAIFALILMSVSTNLFATCKLRTLVEQVEISREYINLDELKTSLLEEKKL